MPLRTWRILSVVLLAVVLMCAAVLVALPQAQRATERGTVSGFPPPVQGADQLIIGVNASLEQYDDQTLAARLAELKRRGITTVRQSFRWSAIESTPGLFDWQSSDRIFRALAANDMRVLAVLQDTPVWARTETGNASAPPSPTTPPRQPDDFANFAGKFAERYDPPQSGTQNRALSPILAYQIWDEPNLSAAWGNGLINPIGYLRLLRASGEAIHHVHPMATIVLAGLAPTVEQSDVNLAPQQYLAALYDLGGADAFDIVAAKPYGFDNPPEDRRVDPAVLNFSNVILLYETMIVKGDTRKAIWLTQFGWNSLAPNWSGAPSVWGQVTQKQQADYTRQAVERAAREWYWVGGMFAADLESGRPTDPRSGFDLISNGIAKPALDALTDSVRSADAATRGHLFAPCEFTPGPSRPMPLGGCYRPTQIAIFSDGWRFSEQGADPPQPTSAQALAQDPGEPSVEFKFSGIRLSLLVRRGDYRANTFVTVDGKPANALQIEPRGAFLPMWSPDLAPRIEQIEVASHLADGVHTARVSVERGWNQWPLIGWSSSNQPVESNAVPRTIVAILLTICIIGLVVAVRHATWTAAFAGSNNQRFAPVAVATMMILWATSFVSWAQDAAFAFRNFGTPASLVLGAFTSAILVWVPTTTLSLLCLVILSIVVVMRLDIGLALVAFFIPFYIVPQRLFAYSIAMVELLMILCIVSAAIRIARGLIRRQDRHFGMRTLFRQPAFPLDCAVAAFVIVSALSAIQAQQRVEAFRELRLIIVEPALLYAALRAISFSRIERTRMMQAYFAGALTVAGIGLLNYARGNVFEAESGIARIKSVFGSPNNDALYLGRAFVALLGIIMASVQSRLRGRTGGAQQTRIRWLPRFAAVGTGLILFVALVLSQSRGALLLGLPLAVSAMCLALGGRWRLPGTLLLIGLVLALLTLTTGTATRVLAGTRLANALDLTQGTGFFRINLWQSAASMWQDHPWFGVGPDNFLYAYRSHYILPAAWQEPNLSHPHNMVMDFASRLGTFGLAALLLLAIGFTHAAKYGLSRAAPERAASIAAIGVSVYMLGHGLVDQSIFLVDLSYVFMLWAGLMSGRLSAEAPSKTTQNDGYIARTTQTTRP